MSKKNGGVSIYKSFLRYLHCRLFGDPSICSYSGDRMVKFEDLKIKSWNIDECNMILSVGRHYHGLSLKTILVGVTNHSRAIDRVPIFRLEVDSSVNVSDFANGMKTMAEYMYSVGICNKHTCECSDPINAEICKYKRKHTAFYRNRFGE